MPTLDQIEREYRKLSAQVTDAEFDGNVREDAARRLEQLAQWRVDLTAPDFSAAALVGR